MIQLKRVYETPTEKDGTRILVERLWPRGIKKESLPLDAWIKEAAPSTALRQWFAHTPERWNEFRRKYFEELTRKPDAWKPILESARKGSVTLLFSSHDLQHNNAVALKEFLEQSLHAKR